MDRHPPFEQVADVPRAALVQALHAAGASGEPLPKAQWERDVKVWRAIGAALTAAAARHRVAEPAPPRATGSSGEAGVGVPGWLGGLVRRQVALLAGRWTMYGGFSEIRTLERLGLVNLEADDDYVLAMVSGLGDRWAEFSRASEIRRDPELVDRALWRIFEVEGGGEVSLTNIDKFGSKNTWRDALLELVADGTLARGRVLDACLAALRRDFSSYRTIWFRAMYDALSPTIAEQRERQDVHLALLASDITATVTFAARALTDLDKAGLLDDGAFLDRCGPALPGRPKATVIPLLTILGRVAGRAPDRGEDVARHAASALENDHQQVQQEALGLLQRLEAREPARERLGQLRPSVRQTAAAWLGVPEDVRDAPPDLAPAAPSPFDPAVPPPVGDDADLTSRLAAVLEDPRDPFELELVLAALAVHGDKPAVLAPLVKRARRIRAREEAPWTGSLRLYLACLILCLGGGEGETMPAPHRFYVLLSERLAELAARPDGEPLATPTGPGGWIDPKTLVERARALTGEPRPHDAVAALLRLAPDGREPAGDLPGEFGAALGYALGGEPPRGTVSPALLVAAACARSPFADDDPHLAAAGLRRPSPLDPRFGDLTFDGEIWWRADFRAPDILNLTGPHSPASPDLVAAPVDGWTGWAATTWPHDADPFFAHGLTCVLSTVFIDIPYREAGVLFDALLTHPGRFGKVAALTLALGLNARAPEQAATAAEAFAVLVPAGRVPPEALADALGRTAPRATATRWARSLGTAADAGAGAADAVVDTLVHLLPLLPVDLRGRHALLGLLHDQAVRTRRPITDPRLRAWLGELTGSSAAARTARALLAHAPDGNAP
ncbi:DUF6493 family protein [Spirillospora sp. NPDC047279]|uniref:DUF6493 family protein n=1 Tax=Spirillospora sp. NPDC047279 TaxID=3155478 RepID=UPI0033DDDD1A